MRRFFIGFIATIAVGALVIQFVPYGRAHENPPVIAELAWDSVETRSLVMSACFDCHSNETEWPWYANVAPFSWLVQGDLDEGRAVLNFSEWGPGQEADEVVEVVQEGETPPFSYGLTHPGSRLSDAYRTTLIEGLRATFGGH